MQYKTIMFDFFGVISSEIAPHWFEKHFSKIDAATLKEKYARPADSEEISEIEYFAQLAKLVSEKPEDIRNEWMSMVSINLNLVDYIKALRRNFQIVLCSNAPSPFLREILEKNTLSILFDTIIISSEIHAIKPEPDFFRLVLDRCAIKPEESVFIDDNNNNVIGAESIGIKGFVFSSLAQLKDSLESLEIKSSS